MYFNLLVEENWKLPTFTDNIAKMCKWVIYKPVVKAFTVNAGMGIFWDNVNKLIYFSGLKIFFNPKPLL